MLEWSEYLCPYFKRLTKFCKGIIAEVWAANRKLITKPLEVIFMVLLSFIALQFSEIAA